jgi:hypothetical protein
MLVDVKKAFQTIKTIVEEIGTFQQAVEKNKGKNIQRVAVVYFEGHYNDVLKFSVNVDGDTFAIKEKLKQKGMYWTGYDWTRKFQNVEEAINFVKQLLAEGLVDASYFEKNSLVLESFLVGVVKKAKEQNDNEFLKEVVEFISKK